MVYDKDMCWQCIDVRRQIVDVQEIISYKLQLL